MVDKIPLEENAYITLHYFLTEINNFHFDHYLMVDLLLKAREIF